MLTLLLATFVFEMMHPILIKRYSLRMLQVAVLYKTELNQFGLLCKICETGYVEMTSLYVLLLCNYLLYKVLV